MSLRRPTAMLFAYDCVDAGTEENLKDQAVLAESALDRFLCLLCFRLVHLLHRPHQNGRTHGVHSSAIALLIGLFLSSR